MIRSILTRSAYRNLHPGVWLALFVGFAVALRWGSFFISVINHDESTYIVIADELLRGGTYLRDAIDTKPIGIFWVYAVLIKVTGGSIAALRLAAATAVGLGGWGLYLATRRALRHDVAAVAAGLIYCVMCSIFSYYGLSPNTEIFFNGLTIAAVALAVAPRAGARRDPFWHWPVAGLLLGLAVIIKPFAAAEALAVGLFMVWYYVRAGRWGRMLGAGLALVGAFSLPLAGVYSYYAGLGMLDTLSFYLFEVNGAYPIELAWYLRLKYMGDYLLRYAPFVVLGAWLPIKFGSRWALARVRGWGNKRTAGLGQGAAQLTRTRVWWYYLLLQFLIVTAVVLVTGKRFGHYQVQLHPALALLAATFWAGGYSWWRGRAGEVVRRYTPTLLLAMAAGLGTMYLFYYGAKEDRPAKIAEYLEPRLGPEDTFFGLNGFQITYHLLGRPAPTPYVHSSLLFLDHHVRAFQIDELAEARRLLANPNLTYLVGRTEDADADTPLRDALLRHFTPVDTLEGDLIFYYRE